MKYFLFLIFSLNSSYIFSQESSNSSGNTFSGTGGTISFSLGQISNANATATNGNINVGVHQPYLVEEVPDGIDSKTNNSIKIYPNPTTDYLNLTVSEIDLNSSHYLLLNAEGKIISEEKINATTNKISLIEKESGIYFIVVYTNNIKVKSFRIIKNK